MTRVQGREGTSRRRACPPEADEASLIGRCQHGTRRFAALWVRGRKSQGDDPILVAAQGGVELTRGHSPQFHGPVLASAGQRLSVGGEGDSEDPAGVLLGGALERKALDRRISAVIRPLQ